MTDKIIESIFFQFTFNLFDSNSTVVDPGGGATGACPPKGPDSFVLTYKFFET